VTSMSPRVSSLKPWASNSANPCGRDLGVRESPAGLRCPASTDMREGTAPPCDRPSIQTLICVLPTRFAINA